MTRYACGYLLDDTGRVVLIRKKRPSWQAGRLNGVGGKAHDGETTAAAMRREFAEETGVDVDGWQHFATIVWDSGETHFFKLTQPADVLDQTRSVTDELIEIHRVREVFAMSEEHTVKSLIWLLGLATYPTPFAAPVVARELESPYTAAETAAEATRT